MNLKSRLKPFAAVAFTALAVSTVVAGCSDLKEAQDAACCKEFEAGADMTNVDFGVDASIKGSFSAFATAASDLSAVGTGAISDVTTACRNIALDMGAETTDPKVAGVTGTAALTAWCDLAKAKISGSFGTNGTLGGTVSVKYEAPKCSASLSATANCQASCDASAKCDIKANPPKCEGGTLSVECSGGCTAEGKAELSCTGSCSGSCSGSCTAKAGATVACDGTCEGTCTAGAGGDETGIQADGTCKGKCEGSCTLKADAKVECEGTCDGKCDAKCSGTATVKAKCDGKCDADYTPLKCEGGTLSGGCEVDASCQGSCNASASAKAECTPPSLAVTATAKAGLNADAQLQYQIALESIKANFPKILVVLEARGKAFTDSFTAALKASADIAGSGKLGAKGAVCGLLIGDTMRTASENFATALSVSGSVAGSVKLN